MKQIRPDHVAIYVRWSTDDQSEGTTLEVQLEGCRHYCLSQGWVPQEALTFVDDGYSGGNLLRPAIERLRRLVRNGEVDCVVVLKVDRLSRNIVDAVDLVLNEWRDVCYFKSAREPIDTSSDLGRVIFGILAMFADFERSQIRERTHSGKVKRIKDGKQLHGEPAFGYQPSGNRGQWAAEPAEAELVRRMFQMAARGMSASAICRQFNGEGLRTRAGKEWSIRGVLWILHNRLYIGEAVFGRSQLKVRQSPERRTKTERIYRDEPLVHVETQAAPPLISQALFDRVQAQLDRNRAARREYGARSLSSRHLLVGLARCRCGGTLVTKQQKRWADYYCHNARSGRCPHNPGYIHQGRADEIVLAQLIALYGSEATRVERLAAAAAHFDLEVAALVAQRSAKEKALLGLDDQESRLMRAARSGALDLKDLRDLRIGIEQERAQASEQLQLLDAQISSSQERVQQARTALDRLGTVRSFDGMPVEQKRDLLRLALAGPIVMYKAKGTHEIQVEIPWAH